MDPLILGREYRAALIDAYRHRDVGDRAQAAHEAAIVLDEKAAAIPFRDLPALAAALMGACAAHGLEDEAARIEDIMGTLGLLDEGVF